MSVDDEKSRVERIESKQKVKSLPIVERSAHQQLFLTSVNL